MVFLDDDSIAQQLATELARKAPHQLEVAMLPISAFQFTALVQLALRHPGVSPEIRATAQKFLTGVRAYFADCPAVLDVIRRGDDPTEDR